MQHVTSYLMQLVFLNFCRKMYLLVTKRSGKTSRRKCEREVFETDCQACTGCVTFCCLLTS